jgi:hypothetical protein
MMRVVVVVLLLLLVMMTTWRGNRQRLALHVFLVVVLP